LQILIFDSKGREVKKYPNVRPPTFILQKNSLANGLYLLQIRDKENIIGNIKFIIQQSVQ
ncbi:MAG: T9SS type A sorting domain-containing protein, partial [Bacteroidota bacterium]|nr:T9SS type A sorting domain-containing protein [Bacteroidota bacterium]